MGRSPLIGPRLLVGALVLLLLAYLWLPAWAQVTVTLAIAVGSTIAVVVGIRRHDPQGAPRRAWWLLAVGTGGLALGDLVFELVSIGRETAPFPSVADAVYLPATVTLIVGVLLLVRAVRPTRFRDSLLEAGVVVCSGAIVLWFVVVAPLVFDPALSALERGVSLAYPALALVILGVLAVSLVTGLSRRPALLLLTGATAALLVSDLAYALIATTYESGHPAEIGWLVSFLLFAAAANHPSMAVDTNPAPPGVEIGRIQVITLWVAMVGGMMVLAGFLFGQLPAEETLRADLIVGSALIITAAMLVLWRLTRSAASLGRVWRQREAAAQREQLLAATSTRLSRAEELPELFAAVAAAAPILGVDSGALQLSLPEVEDGGYRGDAATAGWSPPAVAPASVASTRIALGGGPGEGALVITPAVADDDEVLGALRVLAGDVGLARSRLQLARDLRRSEERFRALVRNAPDAITIHDREGVVTYASPAMGRILGVEVETLLGAPWQARIDPRDREPFGASLATAAREPDRPVRLEYRVTDTRGTQRWLEAWITNLLAEPGVHGIVANHRDTTASHHLRARLEHEATHDALTGLANRRRFTRALERSQLAGRGALVLIDLDRFKAINDRFGHAAGDEVLLEVTHRLLTTIRPTDLAARLGGDEFAVLLPDTGADEAATIVQRLRTRVAEPMQIQGAELTMTASFGTAAIDATAGGSDALLHAADLAMYTDKRRGSGTGVRPDVEVS